MQPSSSMNSMNSMKLSSSVCQDDMKSQSKVSEQTAQLNNGCQKVTTIAMVGGVSIVVILSLLVSAFAAAPPDEETVVDCNLSVGSETTLTLMCFAMGWICCYVMKRQDDIAKQVCKICCSAKELLHSFCAKASAAVSVVVNLYRTIAARPAMVIAQTTRKQAEIAGMILAGTVFTCGILGLFISAFTAVPDAEPSADGLASESSQSMRIFTVGWMFLLSLKLRREMVGLMGSSCLFQPW